jgi:hypothetical protein
MNFGTLAHDDGWWGRRNYDSSVFSIFNYLKKDLFLSFPDHGKFPKVKLVD